MKKIAVAIYFLIFLNTTISAQQKFRFGLQISPTLTWMTSTDNGINDNGKNVGLKLGVLGESYFAENYSFVFGLNFAFNQGGTLKYDVGGNLWPKSQLSDDRYQAEDKGAIPDGANLKYSLQYVEIPFGLRLRTQEFGYFRYFAEIPVFTVGFNTQAEGAITGTDMDTENENISDDINTFAFSWGLGGGVEYSIGTQTSLVAGIFYQSYITDVTKDDGWLYTERDPPGNGPPTDPLDPTVKVAEDSKTLIKGLTLRIGVMF